MKKLSFLFMISLIMITGCNVANDSTKIPIEVKNNIPGSPQVFGIPVPKGELFSPDHVRMLDSRGNEIPSQITKVSTWEPADNSIKWMWVFFFTDEETDYTVEYGPEVRNSMDYDQILTVKNNQRVTGEVTVNTGPLRFEVNKGEGGGFFNAPAGSGFLDKVELDIDGDGFTETDVIAEGKEGRSSFLDIIDGMGLDRSKAVVTRTVKELGSGPLHAIIRVEGKYQYSREDNNSAPFITRIHTYAGKSYIKVQHTFVYTGIPDNHSVPSGEYEAIATQNGIVIDEGELSEDEGFIEPNDQIAATGLSLKYNMSDNKTVTTSYYDGKWWDTGNSQFVQSSLSNEASVLQTGPNPSQIPPLANSSPEQRLQNVFNATIKIDDQTNISAERAAGWVDLSDDKWGVMVGFKSFFEEYPKEIKVEEAEEDITAYIWTPSVEPQSFARKDLDNDSGMIANFAQGLAKTTEMVFYFHKKSTSADVEKTAKMFLDGSVTHADPDWYAKSEAFGKLAAQKEKFASYERGLDYKFQWMKFNQEWEPWYGMLNYGDNLTYYYGNEWGQWTNNEPGNDYMWWLQFIRTGNPMYYRTAQAASMHTMDVDNIHWPKDPVYIGDTNESIHYFQNLEEPEGSPYVGMGRRHADQHYSSLLSAHVWVPGWVTSYYLDANHRGLEVAMQTGDYYVKRVFGGHGLRGRRLYLSVWNLAEIYDATKMDVYGDELKDRVDIMLELQHHPDQGGEMVINRYGYSQVYVTNGLRKYVQLTGDEEVKNAMIDHARRLRDVPPYNHDMESYLSSISSLVLGYEYSGEPSFLEEAADRAQYLKTDELVQEFDSYENQKILAEALEEASNFPKDPGARRPPIWQITNGLRIFGWTSIYNVPYLEYWMEKENYPAER
ncbi:exo-rhamnogalacturonan lyase family protein [Gracilimonas halophila]